MSAINALLSNSVRYFPATATNRKTVAAKHQAIEQGPFEWLFPNGHGQIEIPLCLKPTNTLFCRSFFKLQFNELFSSLLSMLGFEILVGPVDFFGFYFCCIFNGITH